MGRVCVCVWGQPLFPRDLRIFSVFQHFSFFSFKAGGASSPFSLAPTKTLDECWWYLTWSVRRTCHETISISEFCDSFTAATVLNLSFFKTCLSTTAFSRAKNHKSIWASWTDILSYKCVAGRDSVMALSWSWLSQAIESPPLKRISRISKILKWTLWIVSVSWPQIRILWFSPYQSTSVNMKHDQLDWDSFFQFSSCPPLWVIRRNRLFMHVFLVWIYTAWNTSLIVFGPDSERLRTSLWLSLLDLWDYDSLSESLWTSELLRKSSNLNGHFGYHSDEFPLKQFTSVTRCRTETQEAFKN